MRQTQRDKHCFAHRHVQDPKCGFPAPQPADSSIAAIAVSSTPLRATRTGIYLSHQRSVARLDISGWKLEGAVDFTFAGTSFLPGRFLCFSNVRAFRARRNPTGPRRAFHARPVSGHLSARGETLRVRNNSGTIVSSFSYTGAPSLAQQFLQSQNHVPSGVNLRRSEFTRGLRIHSAEEHFRQHCARSLGRALYQRHFFQLYGQQHYQSHAGRLRSDRQKPRQFH